MRLKQGIHSTISFLLFTSVGLNGFVIGLGLAFPTQAIAAAPTSAVSKIINSLNPQKSPLTPPETNEPKPSNTKGGV